jgi:pantoate kinase
MINPGCGLGVSGASSLGTGLLAATSVFGSGGVEFACGVGALGNSVFG